MLCRRCFRFSSFALNKTLCYSSKLARNHPIGFNSFATGPTFLPSKRCFSMKLPRKYPIGIDDYKKIVEGKYFHWDRSLFLKEFYEDAGESVLILRPRRWAKTTTVSMAKYFFDITNPALAESLFAQTQLARQDKVFYDSCSGQFPVISISFSECYAPTWEIMESLLRTVICGAYNDHIYLFKTTEFLEEHERRRFEAILNEDPSVVYQTALKNLTELLHRYHKKKVIVLIDEYDKPVNEAYQEGYFKDALKFLTSTFTGCLKSNPHLEKGLMTGVLRVAKAGYLSGLNNLRVYSFLDKRYADKYGVSEGEMQASLKYEELESNADDVRQYYDGYDTAISELRLYNPWSVINYLEDKPTNPSPYWVETGRTDFLAETLWAAPMETRDILLDLFNGEKCSVPFAVDIDFNTMGDDTSLWSLLYFSGYLTGLRDNGEKVDIGENLEVGEAVELRIPNTEVKRELALMWRKHMKLKGLGGEHKKFLNALVVGDEKTMYSELRNIMQSVKMSYHDDARDPEAFYHGLMLPLLFPLITLDYRIESNREMGHGRVDIVLHPPKGRPAVIIELKTRKGEEERKKVKSDEVLEADALVAIKQIKDRKYYQDLKPDVKNVILCGIGSSKKFVFVKMEQISL